MDQLEQINREAKEFITIVIDVLCDPLLLKVTANTKTIATLFKNIEFLQVFKEADIPLGSNGISVAFTGIPICVNEDLWDGLVELSYILQPRATSKNYGFIKEMFRDFTYTYNYIIEMD